MIDTVMYRALLAEFLAFMWVSFKCCTMFPRYTQLWDQWNKLKKQNLPCTHELDQMNRKAKIIIERFIEFQKALNIQVFYFIMLAM